MEIDNRDHQRQRLFLKESFGFAHVFGHLLFEILELHTQKMENYRSRCLQVSVSTVDKPEAGSLVETDIL